MLGNSSLTKKDGSALLSRTSHIFRSFSVLSSLFPSPCLSVGVSCFSHVFSGSMLIRRTVSSIILLVSFEEVCEKVQKPVLPVQAIDHM